MKIKTSELSGPALRWAVAKADGYHYFPKDDGPTYVHKDSGDWHSAGGYQPDTKWHQGGPIIEREGIELLCNLTEAEAARFKVAHADWQAYYRQKRSTEQRKHGRTPLIAAMRCYVASKLGDEVDVPEELT